MTETEIEGEREEICSVDPPPPYTTIAIRTVRLSVDYGCLCIFFSSFFSFKGRKYVRRYVYIEVIMKIRRLLFRIDIFGAGSEFRDSG